MTIETHIATPNQPTTPRQNTDSLKTFPIATSGYIGPVTQKQGKPCEFVNAGTTDYVSVKLKGASDYCWKVGDVYNAPPVGAYDLYARTTPCGGHDTGCGDPTPNGTLTVSP